MGSVPVVGQEVGDHYIDRPVMFRDSRAGGEIPLAFPQAFV